MENHAPQNVWKYFKEISQIPRCSGQEQAISDYLIAFAKQRNLEYYRDDFLNVIIKKPATPGYENAPSVILQGHMDMVCEKNSDITHDFDKDGIKWTIEGDWLTAQGTTLGADNGIAMAYCLALLNAQDIPHTPLEVVITTQEEVGLIGAANMDVSPLTGRYLINLDAEDEGVLFASCAGGGRLSMELPIAWQDAPKGDYKAYGLYISGLKGGHSGMDIHKNRGNANKLLGRILNGLNMCLYHIEGGSKSNAIPREAHAKLWVNTTDISKLSAKVETFNAIFKNELKTSDKDVKVEIKEIDEKNIEKVFSQDTLNRLNIIYMLTPCGVHSMSSDMEGLVESSTNFGVIETGVASIFFHNTTRSAVNSLKEALFEQLHILAQTTGAHVTLHGVYPGWEYQKNSKLREKFVSVYKNLYQKEPEIAAIHAGLECGIFSEKLGDIDIIALGPDILDVHSPDEKISLSSTQRTWEYLCAVLKELKD